MTRWLLAAIVVLLLAVPLGVEHLYSTYYLQLLTWVLIFGLVLSVALMAFASTKIAGLLQKHHWIAYIGLAVIFFISVSMIYEGAVEVMGRMK